MASQQKSLKINKTQDSRLGSLQIEPNGTSTRTAVVIPEVTRYENVSGSQQTQPSDRRSLQGSVQGSGQGMFQGSLQGSVEVGCRTVVPPSISLRAFWPKACNRKSHSERLMFVMRSAERMDRVFGSDWMATEMPYGTLCPTDQNVPKSLRKITNHNFKLDPPITDIGKYSSQLVARAMMARQCAPCMIICSPALRSIQTACSMASMLKMKVGIEPGLFEPLSWYRDNDQIPSSFLYDTLIKAGYPIDEDYKPIVQRSHLVSRAPFETEAEGRQRIELVLRSLGNYVRTGSLLVVAHAITLHTTYFITKSTVTEEDDDMQFTSMECQWENAGVDQDIGTEELGLRYPPGSVMSIARMSDSPPYSYRNIPSLIPPLSYGTQFCNKPVHPVA